MMAATMLTLLVSARTQEIRAWRGETVAARIDDPTEIVGKLPAGL